MKRLLLTLALGAGLLACSETDTVPTAAGLSGTYDLTLVGRLVFVTSSDRDELRVLDLDTSPRDFVRAPNPLEPLSIPVLDRPLALARDLQYNEKGEEVAGPYVYARSAGSQEISVVAADRATLREVRRLVAPGLVTAITARGPATPGAKSQLFYATQSPSGAQVWMQELPGPEALLSETTALDPAKVVLPLAAGETVQALLALPPANPAENSLVVATRRNVGQGGRTLRVDVSAPDQFVELKFGAPVRVLATHPRAFRLVDHDQDPKTEPQEEEFLAAGQRIFGILDESSCGALAACAGVLAVERSTGEVAKDRLAITSFPPVREGEPPVEERIDGYQEGWGMLPITVGSALPTGLTLAANPQLLVTTRRKGVQTINNELTEVFSEVKRVDRIPLLGIVPASNGEITLFNALELRHFDFDALDASSQVLLRDVAEAPKTTGRDNVLSAEVVNGATRTDVYRLIFQGGLPGLIGVGRTAEASAPFEVERAAAERTGVRPGDSITLESDAGPCPVELTVTGVTAGSRTDTSTLLTNGPTPEECATFPRFTVRAGGAEQPFVVTSETQGFVARMGPGETYTQGGTYFYHPVGFNPDVAPFQVRLTLEPSLDPNLVRGDRYVVPVDGHFVPFVARVNTTDPTAGLATYRLPASVIYAVANDGIDYAYIAYPSADGILQANLEGLFYEVSNSTNLRYFE